MPERATSLTAAAGEYYVAYMLSCRGYLVGQSRGGSPTADLLVGDPATDLALMVQVKTSSWAWREQKRNPSKNRWEWDVGPRAMHVNRDSNSDAFVDLRGDLAGSH